ncbi:MAG: pyruvate dehydrogenase (acetyl-transferring) E1 component subunit alpha [Nitrospira sp.]|nr:pyruvate dehydrogenase (acetyl-transferring) E1 component subunit alpha [Candidatus Manganitrophaceae bacterium]HIL34951.1 pyruvate dehydrogenase (acetyl-transferring) E1 component subunit alpha [Candidatus Manganitrophaceae bacterium]
MPKKVLKRFEVTYLQILNETGQTDPTLQYGPQKITEKEARAFYHSMVLIRAFDEKALNLQRAGRIGTYASILGQEAIQVGCAFALDQSDWLFPAFRESGLLLLRDIPMKMLYQYWSGDERGSAFPENHHDFPVSIPVGTHIPHAVGAAWAAQFKRDPIAVMATFGDGATSKGDFHEGLNFAGVMRLPVVFVCQNNQWAISLPLSQQTASSTLAQKAISYGFEGLQVDGNDVFGVYVSTKNALEKARQGGGPTLIECVTYRLSDHTTADDASRYRSEEDVVIWRKKDPLTRLRTYLEKEYHWSNSEETDLLQETKKKIASAVAELESLEPPDPEEMFDHVFETLSPALIQQKNQLRKRLQGESKS